MCRRYALFGNKMPEADAAPGEVADGFNERVIGLLTGLEARYNIAPTQLASACTLGEDGPVLESMRWGLLPPWATNDKKAYSTINARADAVRTTPAFRDAWNLDQRCLVPASGWYAWLEKGAGDGVPYFLDPADGENPVMLAGLYTRWKGPTGKTMGTFTIITTPSSGEAAKITARMPRRLAPGDWQTWLAGTSDEAVAFLAASDSPWNAQQVGASIGNHRNQGPQLIAAVVPA